MKGGALLMLNAGAEYVLTMDAARARTMTLFKVASLFSDR